MAAALGAAAIGGWAVATDQVSYEITYGVSMDPVYHQGDLVFLTKADSYDVGDIAAYHGSSPGLVVLHRIIGGDATGFVFKGDNNQSIDPDKPTADQLIGRAVLHVPKGGLWLGPLLSPTGLGMIGFMIVSGGAAAAKTRREIPRGRRKKKVKAMSGKGTLGTAAAVVKAIAAMPPLLRALACVLTAVGLLGVGLAVVGWMGPLTVKQRVEAADGQSMTFAYAAKVPEGPAYDGTVVESPEPLFRKVVDTVDLRLNYRGAPGTVEVAATLATASGWHTRMPLASPTAFPGERYEGVVRLNLDQIEARAKAAADAIGVEPGPISVGVAATVTSRRAMVFTPTLQLTLTSLQLTLAGGESSLVVNASPAAGSPPMAARDIAVAGFHLMTAETARLWAVSLLLGVLFGGIGVALVARRTTPVHSGSEIHSRFPQLLVAVEPMASPPGKPVVNVGDFLALVRLAERYGQLILHWSRGDVETFVVRDEGITYRYRTAVEEPSTAEQPPMLQSVERPRDEQALDDGEPADAATPEADRQPSRRRAPRKTAV